MHRRRRCRADREDRPLLRSVPLLGLLKIPLGSRGQLAAWIQDRLKVRSSGGGQPRREQETFIAETVGYGWYQLMVCSYLKRTQEEFLDTPCPKSGGALPEQGRKDHNTEAAVELVGETRLDPKTLDLAVVDQATSK